MGIAIFDYNKDLYVIHDNIKRKTLYFIFVDKIILQDRLPSVDGFLTKNILE